MHRSSTHSPTDVLHQRGTVEMNRRLQTELDPLPWKKRFGLFQAQRRRQPGIIAQHRMHIQRDMAAVNSQARLHGQRQLPEQGALNPLQA